MCRVLDLMDTDTDCTLVHVNPYWFFWMINIEGYGCHIFKVKAVTLLLTTGHLAHWQYIMMSPQYLNIF